MRWDIFCQIVDNYGDAGVCWRLARSLSSLHGQQVRIFCDDLPTLNLLASGSDEALGRKIDIQPWETSYSNARHPVETPDVVIEAFGCDLPDHFLQWAAVHSELATPVQTPVWLNLEYLSAESYVERSHKLPSPVMSGPGSGLTKHFFYPGFTADTGGLLREPEEINRLLGALREAVPGRFTVKTRIGYAVKRDMPGLKGPEVEALYADGRAWLAGGPLNR